MRKTNMGLFGIVLFFFCLVTFGTNVQAETVNEEPKILNGVFIGSVDVSGMTREQAAQEVEKHLNQIRGYNIQLGVADQVVSITAGELGLSWDQDQILDNAFAFGQSGNIVKRYKVQKDLKEESRRLSLYYSIDREKAQAMIEERCADFDRDPVNASMLREDDAFTINKEQSGITLNVAESIDLVEEYLTKLWREGAGKVELSAEIQEAKHKSAGLTEVTDVLGYASTDYSSSSANRAQNIRTGTEKLDAITLFPGETYSVCDAMVPFSEENGYKPGASFENGSVVESFGGGICQVSSTLYLALLRAEIEIVERKNHSMVVNYVKHSMDAAIAEDTKDLQFRNNLDVPIYIESYTDGGLVGFLVYGKEYRSEDRDVTYESETLETTEPTAKLTASDKPAGNIEQTESSHTGYKARLWKVVTQDGEETRTQVNESTYQMQPARYSVGTKTEDSELASKIYDAISDNDLDAVYSAIN